MWIDRLALDLKTAIRSVARYPVAASIAILSLGAGIGAATITLTMRDVIFFNPPPLFADPDRLSSIGVTTVERSRGRVPAALYQQWTAAAPQGYTLAAALAPAMRDVRAADRTETVAVRAVTPGAFALLGVAPAIGRPFDSRAGMHREAILSHGAWGTLFAERADIIGQTVWIENAPYTVIGVMPRRFWWLSMNVVAVWTALDAHTVATSVLMDVVARRDPRTSSDDLQQRLQASAAAYLASLPAAQQRLRVNVASVGGTPLGGAIGPVPVILMGMSVLLTLFIACTNVAILMFSQWAAREHEIAIRASIGASRGRLVRTLVTESMAMAAAGAGVGVIVTLWLRDLIARNGDQAGMLDLSIRPAIFVQTAVIALAAGLATGLAPALLETRRLQRNPLRQLRSSDRVRQRWRHALVGVEIAITVALLVVAGALVSGYRRTLAYDPGFDPKPLMSLGVESPAGLDVDAVRGRLARIDGVAAVSPATSLPFTGPFAQASVAADAHGSGAMAANRADIADDYFATLAVGMRAGRGMTREEARSTQRIAIVNEALAARLWPQRTAIGAQLWIDGTAHDVIGVVADYSNATLRPVRPAVFLPLGPHSPKPTTMKFLVRFSGNAGSLAEQVRREIDEVVSQSTPLTVIQTIGAQEILVLTYPMAPLITLGLLLTAAGIYGVLAFAVARRAGELAVRVAVGARGRDLVALVLSQSLRLVAVGLMCGIGATFALTRIAQGSGGIFDSPGWEAFVIPAAIVLAVAFAATWFPCRRALRIDPVTVLRAN
jgi:predicted permease